MSEKFRRRKSTEERRLRGLLELAPAAMVVVDQAGMIVLANAQTENLFGYRQQEELGHHVEVLIPQRFRERHKGHRINFLSEPQVRPMTPNPVSPGNLDHVPSKLKAELCAILELAPFERFVFVMSVLEHYCEHDCSILLGCSRRDIAATLAIAVQHLARLMSLHKNETDGSSGGLAGFENSRPVIDLTIAGHFTLPGWNPSLSYKRAFSAMDMARGVT